MDLLLECTFSYMQNAEEGPDHQLGEEDEFLSPLIGPEEEEEVCLHSRFCQAYSDLHLNTTADTPEPHRLDIQTEAARN